MSLVTRCPVCSTLFKVVPDQLRLSEGWVRCGQCGDVFDAMAQMLPQAQSTGLQPVVGGAPVAAPRAALAPPPEAHAETVPVPLQASAPPPAPDESVFASADEPIGEEPSGSSWPERSAGDDEASVSSAVAPPVAAQVPAPPAAPILPMARTEAPPTAPLPPPQPAWPALELDSPAEPEPEPEPPAMIRIAEAAPAAAEPSASEATPSFVAAAERRAFWASTPMRLLLGLLALLLLAGLAAQVAIGQRDWLAAREPRTIPWLQALCQPLGCTLRPYRRIEALIIDSSSFNRTGPSSFRLSATVRNTAPLPVASPALELTLTDAQDQALIRRVLSAEELGMPPALAARGEFTGALGLSVDAGGSGPAVVGYRLLAFYP